MADARIVALVACLGLAACGATDAGTPPPSPKPTLATTYTGLVKAPNEAGDRLRAASEDPAATIANLRPMAQTFMDSLIQLNHDLIAFEAQVPAADRTDVENLRQTLSKDQADLLTMIAAGSVQQFNAAYAKLSSDDAGTSATTVRSDLGLDAGNP
jgi:hypothetical protein